jgi:ribonuclease BN (tRNA processing enzyme)
VAELAGGADLLIADASYVDEVPPDLTGTLTSARDAAGQARSAGVRRLMLTHLMPGTDREAARTTATAHFGDAVVVAVPGLVVDLT